MPTMSSMDTLPADVNSWTIDQVVVWLEQNSFGACKDSFIGDC
jgi:hypothetical protein